ncbi:MAG: ThiF family adenylyltransferase [Spirochaetia bacterium]|jgi:tRNA A37 threonylcarbamoyladenosine dehydratase|nr:ThiF family adenylyltransferase [Spirochaetia bacterium]
MNGDFRDRTAILIGSLGMEALEAASVAVYGLGGVGAACAMDLARAGVGRLYVVDFDRVEESNLNRLYFGYREHVGLAKTDAFARSAKAVNPCIEIVERRIFFSGDEAVEIIDSGSAYHADCVDSLNAKANLLAALCASGHSFISSMGTAGRLKPERLKLGSIWESRGCPLAKSLRTRLKRLGVNADFPVVWSDEPPVKPVQRGILKASPEAQVETRLEAQRDVQPDAQRSRQLDVGGGAASGAGGTGGEDGSVYDEAAERPQGRERLVQGSSPFVPQTAGHIMAAWIVRRIVADAS